MKLSQKINGATLINHLPSVACTPVIRTECCESLVYFKTLPLFKRHFSDESSQDPHSSSYVSEDSFVKYSIESIPLHLGSRRYLGTWRISAMNKMCVTFRSILSLMDRHLFLKLVL